MLAPFARSNEGQHYYEFSLETGLTLRQLGKIRRTDPELYEFMESAYLEKQKRISDDLEKARNQ